MVELYERVGPESERVLKQPSTSEAGFRDVLRNFGDFRLLTQAALRNDNTYVKSMAGPHQYDTIKWAALGGFIMFDWDWSPHPIPE